MLEANLCSKKTRDTPWINTICDWNGTVKTWLKLIKWCSLIRFLSVYHPTPQSSLNTICPNRQRLFRRTNFVSISVKLQNKRVRLPWMTYLNLIRSGTGEVIRECVTWAIRISDIYPGSEILILFLVVTHAHGHCLVNVTSWCDSANQRIQGLLEA